MKQLRLIGLIGVIIAALWVEGATLRAGVRMAYAEDTSMQDASAGDEGPEDTTSPDSGPSSTSKPVVAGGHWSGTMSDAALEAGTLDLLISQNRRKLGGGFDISGFQGTEEGLYGNLTGQASVGGSSLRRGVKPP
jgi:hypothetical protein